MKTEISNVEETEFSEIKLSFQLFISTEVMVVVVVVVVITYIIQRWKIDHLLYFVLILYISFFFLE